MAKPGVKNDQTDLYVQGQTMKKLFHIRRFGAPSFRVGRRYEFGGSENYFARDLFSGDIRQEVKGIGRLWFDEILDDYFDPSGNGWWRQLGTKEEKSESATDALVRAAKRILHHQSMMLRELAFEEVRQTEFPEKPSRLRGIWLIPENAGALERWCATLPSGSFRVFELEVNGVIHAGQSSWLLPRCENVKTLRENARGYWSGNILENEEYEYLAEGEVRVINEIVVPGCKTPPKKGHWRRLLRIT